MISGISVARKLFLIYVLDMIAVIFLAYTLMEEKYIFIDFARKEIVGNEYIAVVRDSMFSLIRHWNLARDREPGDDAPVVAAREALIERTGAVVEAEGRLGRDMDSAALVAALAEAGRNVAGGARDPDLAELDDRHRRAMTLHRDLIARIGDMSNLILDPDLDSYYTMSMVVVRFPELIDLVHQIATRAHVGLGREPLTGDDKSEFLILEGNLKGTVRGLLSDIAASYRGNPDGSLRRNLEPGLNRAEVALTAFVTAMHELVIDHGREQADAARIDALLHQTLGASEAAWAQAAAELNRLVDRRIQGFYQRMAYHFGLAALILAAILSLVVLVARRIALPIRHLADVARRVRQADDFSLRARWSSGDEIGHLVESFNAMLDRLQVEAARQQELTARARAASAQRELVEAIPVALVIARLADGEILHANVPASRLFGIRTDDTRDHRLADYFLDAQDYQRLSSLLAQDGEVNALEARCRAAASDPVWTLISARELQYQGAPALLAMVTPITELKRLEAELRASKDAAERAVAELRDTQASLIQAEKMASLGSLVAGIAHEINTPLGITLSAASHLGRETRGLCESFEAGKVRKADFQHYIDTATEATGLILSNSTRAAELIQGFKQVAVDQTSAKRRRFRLRQYLDEVLLSLGPRLKKTPHKVTLDCPDDLELDSYPGALSQVITNFVMNSLIHAYDEGRAGHIGIQVTQPAPDVIELCYSDDGAGIPAEIQGRIFDPFFTTKRGSGGSGLGLNIVYNIVTGTLKGDIAVRSADGGGTTFVMRFPCVAPAVPATTGA